MGTIEPTRAMDWWWLVVTISLAQCACTAGVLRLSVNGTIGSGDIRILLDHLTENASHPSPLIITFDGHAELPSTLNLIPPPGPEMRVLYEDRNLKLGLSDVDAPTTVSPSTACPFHTLGSCKVWWPINNSELHLHARVPSGLSPLRVKQKMIVRCPHNLLTSIFITDSPGSAKERHMEIEIQGEGAQEVHYSIHLHHEDPDYHRVEFAISARGTILTPSLQIILIKCYGTDMRHAAGQVLHPWASTLESRDDLGFALRALLPTANYVVEVGVCTAQFAELLLLTNSDLIYVGVDSWRAWGNDIYEDIANLGADQQQSHLSVAASRLSNFQGRAHLLRAESILAASWFRRNSIDMVYLDAMHHYAAVEKDLLAWWPVVKPCGLLAGHDYLLSVVGNTVFTVKPAVQEFARKHGGLLVLQTLDTEESSPYPTWLLFKPCH